MNIKHLLKTIAILLCIVAVFGVAMFGLNFITGPIIEENNKGAEFGPLLEVLPEGKNFEAIEDLASLGLSESVTNAYKETNGAGYVFRITSTGYKPGMVIMVGIDAEGKITGSKCLETQDTYQKESQIDNSYNGQSLADFKPNMLAGATMTSTGYRDAVNTALQSFILASGGTIDPALTIIDLLPTVAPGFTNPAEVEASGNMKKAYKAANDAGFAYTFSDGEVAFLAIVNATGTCAVYDAEGNNVTDAHTDLAEEAKAHATANQKSYTEALTTKITRLYEDASEITEIDNSLFNTVVSAVTFKSNGADYYGFYSRSIGFDQMDVYVIIDANGAIAKVDAKAFFFKEEYFDADDSVDISAYKNSFSGLTESTFTGDNTVITGATYTSNAVKQSINDAFDAFTSIKGGAQ